MSKPTRELSEIIRIEKGAHASFADGNCAMELVAFMAHEKHSDHPVCASETIGNFVRPWNDALDDDTRQRLAPYLARIVGTRGTAAHEQQRREMLWDWVLTVYVPTWLRAAGLNGAADDLLRHGDAALAAAWDAALAAARDAALAAVRDAARAALRPTVVALQNSAFDLLDRLIRVTETPVVCAIPERVEKLRELGVPV